MKTLRQLLDAKGHDVWSVRPDTSVFDAIEKMADKGVGALLVTDGDSTVGIVSERDYARKVILKGRLSRETPVGDIMTKRVVYADAEKSVQEGMALMTQKHIRHLPVVDDDKLTGMISIGDLVKSIIAEQEFIIEQLETYISGGGPY
jgi:CBS domain-containing protein